MGLRSFAFGMATGAALVLGGQYVMATNMLEGQGLIAPKESMESLIERVTPPPSASENTDTSEDDRAEETSILEALAPKPAEPSDQGQVSDRFSGEASYYAESLDGNPTASGEPYRHNGYTAAHRTLPFGTRVRVTRQDTGQSVVVTINDRGPYAHNRVIDLSGAAASEIDMDIVGVAMVDVEVLSD
ncbi:MAG: septal ring lytic transglycosylase RlpA family protein [Pseudomonadota bacterium]